MTTGMLWLHAGLFVVAFLMMLNGTLRGSLKPHIDAVLSISWVVLLIVGFWAFNWRVGLVAAALSFVYAVVSGPIAREAARAILGRPPR